MDVVSSLWVGSLSPLEHLCMRSFLKQGHPVHLYSYDFLTGPEGVEMKDADDILPRASISRFQNLANFSDFFRYTLLMKRGGWWVDLDVFCLRPFVFSEPYVFASQLVVQRTNDEITSCVIKAPQRSPLLLWCLEKVSQMNTKQNAWSAIGPALLLEGHRKFGLQSAVQPHRRFCPLHYFEAPANVYGPGSDQHRFASDTLAVHLWHEESRRGKIDKYGRHPGSLYERLQAELAHA